MIVHIRGTLEMLSIRSATVTIENRGHTFRGLTKAMYQYTNHLSETSLTFTT